MARAILTVALLTLSTSLLALAQQDPNDPGLPDSLIIGSADIDSTGQFQSIDIPVYAVTDDSVALYNICMRWRAPLGGVSGTGITYFYPLTDWEVRFDSVAMGDSSIGAFGFYDMPGGGSPPPIFTGYARMWIMSYRFVISPDVPRQTVVLDTFPVGMYQAARFNSFIPRFQTGHITIGPVTGVEEEERESATELRNYPNPFSLPPSFEFSLDKTQHVTLEIYNLLGQRVAVVFDGVLSEGHHVINWRGDVEYPMTPQSMPSGVYFSRLTTSESVVTRKIMLIK